MSGTECNDMSATECNDMARTYSVPAISCGHCQAAIEGEVGTVNGVDVVTVDVERKLVNVVGGDDAEIREAIDRAGYDVDG